MAYLQRQQSTIRMQSFPSHDLRIFVHHDYHYRENFIKAGYLAHDTFGIYQNTASYTFTLMKCIEASKPVNVFITTVTLRIQAHAIPALPPALHHDLVAKVKTELCDIVLRVLTRGAQIVKFRLELNSYGFKHQQKNSDTESNIKWLNFYLKFKKTLRRKKYKFKIVPPNFPLYPKVTENAMLFLNPRTYIIPIPVQKRHSII